MSSRKYPVPTRIKSRRSKSGVTVDAPIVSTVPIREPSPPNPTPNPIRQSVPRVVSRRLRSRLPPTREEQEIESEIDVLRQNMTEAKKHIDSDVPQVVKKIWISKLNTDRDTVLSLRATKNKIIQTNRFNQELNDLMSDTDKKCKLALKKRTPDDIQTAMQMLGELIALLASEKSPLLKKWTNVATILTEIQSIYEENLSVNRLRERAASADANIVNFKKTVSRLEEEIDDLNTRIQGKMSDLKTTQLGIQQSIKEKGHILERLVTQQQQEVRIIKQKWESFQKELSGIPFTRRASPVSL